MSDLIDSGTQQRFRGAKLPLKPMHIWGMRMRLQVEKRWRDLALLDVAIDSKLRGRDLVALRTADVPGGGGAVRRRAIVIQQKTGRPVQFEITDQARQSISRPTRLTASGGQRYRCSTVKPAISAPASCCSDTRSLRAPSATSAWSLMTR